MTPSVQPMSDELARKLGFLNADAYTNAKRLRSVDDTTLAGQRALIDALVVHLVNVEQMLLETKRHVERLEKQLLDTGTVRVG